MIVAGFHVPVMPLVEVNGNTGATEFWHSGAIAVNAGVIWFAMVTLSVVVAPHCPASGVNVYSVGPSMVVFIVAGFHVPVMPLFEVKGSTGATELRQSVAMAVNVGVIWLVIVTLNVVTAPHCPAFGVKV